MTKTKAIRFISQAELDTLNKREIVYPKSGDYSWSFKQRIYVFPINDTYLAEDYRPVAEYLSKELDIVYDYMITLELEGWVHLSKAPYDKDMVEHRVGKLDFPVDNDAYDTGAVYVIPEIRLPYYELKDVVDIQDY